MKKKKTKKAVKKKSGVKRSAKGKSKKSTPAKGSCTQDRTVEVDQANATSAVESGENIQTDSQKSVSVSTPPISSDDRFEEEHEEDINAGHHQSEEFVDEDDSEDLI